jgi:hypothetical protein
MRKEIDRAGRDSALARLEKARADYLVDARRHAELLWKKLRRPISVDDVRAVCPPPAGIDPRVMGAIFHRNAWTPIGLAVVGKHAHARHIRTFVPNREAEWFSRAQPRAVRTGKVA